MCFSKGLVQFVHFIHFSFTCSHINHPGKIHTVMSMDNRQEIINVLSMKEHMVFRNRRTPVGELGRRGRVQPAEPQRECAQNKGLRLREGGCCYCSMAAMAQLRQQVWKSDREQWGGGVQPPWVQDEKVTEHEVLDWRTISKCDRQLSPEDSVDLNSMCNLCGEE